MSVVKVEFKRPAKWKYIEPIVPAIHGLPKWYKDKNRDLPNARPYEIGYTGTFKACPAIFDSMTQGYILPLWTDIYVEPAGELLNGTPVPQFYWREGVSSGEGLTLMKAFDLEAIEGMPGADKTKLTAWKIDSPWLLNTPKGYSTLFVAPLNNKDAMFEAISGVIHTDVFSTFINISFIWTGPPDFKGVLKKGTPMVQMIPFKREEFEYELGFVSPEDEEERLACKKATGEVFAGGYRQIFGQKNKFE